MQSASHATCGMCLAYGLEEPLSYLASIQGVSFFNLLRRALKGGQIK